MLVKEWQLAEFQRCSARLWFATQNESLSIVPLDSPRPITTATRWLWAQQLRTGNKATLKAAKHKWGQAVTSWGIENTLSTKEIRDYITKHLQAYIDYWQWYVNTSLEPLVVGQPFRLQFKENVLVSIPEVILIDEKENLVVSNVSDDNSNHDTITNYTYRARLLAASTLQKANIKMLNFRFNGRLEKATLDSSTLCNQELIRNITWAMDSIAAKVNMPIMNCTFQCPYKEKCFR